MDKKKETLMRTEKKKKSLWRMVGKLLIGLLLLNSLLLLFNFLLVPEIKYRKAVELVEGKQYAAAIEAFTELGNYKDSGAQLLPLYDMVNSYARVGATVYYGTYEQDKDMTNGKEKIAWQVLAQEQDKVLLLSEKNLDCVIYNLEDKAVTWETCTLRTWLNNEFLKAAFSKDEQASILVTQVQTEDNSIYHTKGGTAVSDKLFILSAEEANKFFDNDEERIGPNTPYAVERKAFNSPEGNGWWWLRTPGIQENIAANVNYSGTIDEYGNYVYSIGGGIRPAFWINQADL